MDRESCMPRRRKAGRTHVVMIQTKMLAAVAAVVFLTVPCLAVDPRYLGFSTEKGAPIMPLSTPCWHAQTRFAVIDEIDHEFEKKG